ncbi:hypothetical protein ACLOJK_020825 [Asimina triloba]
MLSAYRILSSFQPPRKRLQSFPLSHHRRPHSITLGPSSSSSKLVACSPCSSSPSMEAPPDGYRRNVGICLTDPSTDKGGVDDGEDPRQAAIRELREETGVTSAEVLAEVPYWLTYDFPSDVREKINGMWGSDWKGQAQKWFLFRLTGKEDEINLLGDGTEKAEFGEWSWMTPQQAVDFKKPVYEEVLKVFSPYLQSKAMKVYVRALLSCQTLKREENGNEEESLCGFLVSL